jgi:hypothetical protein
LSAWSWRSKRVDVHAGGGEDLVGDVLLIVGRSSDAGDDLAEQDEAAVAGIKVGARRELERLRGDNF